MKVLLSGLLGLVLSAAPVPAALALNPPPPQSLTAGIDASPGYQPQKTCSPSAKPGAKALMAALVATWGGSSWGISRMCNVGGTSEHKEGRALDWHMDVRYASDRERVDDALAWITANNGEVAYRLGIQYIIWNQHLWGIYNQAAGWRAMEDRGSYTANHKDHVHISLTWDGAMQQTSWWTGRVVTVPLTGPCGTGSAPGCLPVIERAAASTWPYQQTVVGPFKANQSYFPTIVGTRRFGNTLTANPGSWAPSGASLTYAWLRDDVEIPGATSRTHEIATQDIGATLTVRVRATVGDQHSELTSFGTEILPGAIASVRPEISGPAMTDGVLTVDPGDWTPTPTGFTYQWRRDGKAIGGATGATFTVRPIDVKHDLSVTVKGSAPGFETTARRSNHVVPVKATLTTTPDPWIVGDLVAGGVLTALPGEWAPAPVTLHYRWYRNGRAIKKATGVTYTLKASDLSKTITVKVKGIKAGYVRVTNESAAAGTPLPEPLDAGTVITPPVAGGLPQVPVQGVAVPSPSPSPSVTTSPVTSPSPTASPSVDPTSAPSTP